MSWPSWRYHKEIKPEGKIVRSDAEFEALGPGWVDTPAKFESEPQEEPKLEAPTEEDHKEVLKEEPKPEPIKTEGPTKQKKFTRKMW